MQENAPKVPHLPRLEPKEPPTGQATSLQAGCRWEEDPDERTISHIMYCPTCRDTWPHIARQMRIYTGRALASDDPRYIGANVGYKDK